tara:strand:+ start:2761 stop:3627 length:867 start_codon:yes stop_codon:yes gene_type:complete
MLIPEFLLSNPKLTDNFVTGSPTSRGLFFSELLTLAGSNLALAHSVFKTSACRTVLTVADLNDMSADTIGSFSVHKPYDTVKIVNGKLYGNKHWITNATNASVAIVQIMHEGNIVLCKTTLPPDRTQFLVSPGMMNSNTFDVTFNGESADVLFTKTSEQYFIPSKHNTLCFVTNHLGAVTGLLPHMHEVSDFEFRLRDLKTILLNDVSTTDTHIKSSDEFWHRRNKLYLESKQLLVNTLQRIIEYNAGAFYGLNNMQGQHFFNCLTYSGHNGPIQNNYKQLVTEPQDY